MRSAGAWTGQRGCVLTALCQPHRSPQALLFSLRHPGGPCIPQPASPFYSDSALFSPLLRTPGLLLQVQLLSEQKAGFQTLLVSR